MTALEIRVTVTLMLPIPCESIRRIVQSIIETEDPETTKLFFVEAEDPEHPGLVLVGRASEWEEDHLLVTAPDTLVDGLDPQADYERLVVKSYRWDGAARITRDREVSTLRSVLAFSAALSNALTITGIR